MTEADLMAEDNRVNRVTTYPYGGSGVSTFAWPTARPRSIDVVLGEMAAEQRPPTPAPLLARLGTPSVGWFAVGACAGAVAALALAALIKTRGRK